MNIRGKITRIKNVDNNTKVVVEFNEDIFSKINKFRSNNIIDVEVRVDDGRTITNSQRAKIFAIIKDISLYTGDNPEYLKEFLKFDFCGESGEVYFSLSNCSVDIAREFISHLIDFILKHNIPLSEIALNRTDDIDRYLYGCIKYRRCAITGRAGADIHHCVGSKVGMGGNRKKISNKGRELIALSREWHNKVEADGDYEIFKAYKIYGITLSDEALKELGLSEADIS